MNDEHNLPLHSEATEIMLRRVRTLSLAPLAHLWPGSQSTPLDVATFVALKTLSNYVNRIAYTPLDTQFAAQAWSARTAKVV